MILNPSIQDPTDLNKPMVFLAGPIQGARDWQLEIASKLLESRQDIILATPRVPQKDDGSFVYNNQVAWEKDHLKMASENGCIIFWFCAQDKSLEYEEGRSYAQTTRIEIGRIFGWLDSGKKVNLVVGFDKDYGKNGGGSERYIRSMCDEYDIEVADDIDTLVTQVLKVLG